MINHYRAFIQSIYRLRRKTDAIYSVPGSHQDWRFHYASVNLVSELWQTWSRFCRQLIILSCNGACLRNGGTVAPRTGDNTWQRIAYEVAEYGRGHSPQVGKKIYYRYQEPTWGDVNVLLKAIPHLRLSNSTMLLTALGVSLQAPKHLQVVRNACHHLNNETMNKVRSLQPFYMGPVKHHPIEIIWCLDPASRNHAILVWYDELETIASLAI